MFNGRTNFTKKKEKVFQDFFFFLLLIFFNYIILHCLKKNTFQRIKFLQTPFNILREVFNKKICRLHTKTQQPLKCQLDVLPEKLVIPPTTIMVSVVNSNFFFQFTYTKYFTIINTVV